MLLKELRMSVKVLSGGGGGDIVCYYGGITPSLLSCNVDTHTHTRRVTHTNVNVQLQVRNPCKMNDTKVAMVCSTLSYRDVP